MVTRQRRGAAVLLAVALTTGLVLGVSPASAEDWSWVTGFGGTLGNDYAWGVAADADGNTYVAGWFKNTADFGATSLTSLSPIYYDIFVAKLDIDGNFVWVRSPGGYCPIPSAGCQHGAGVAVDSAGNVYLSGSFTGTATFGATTLVGSGPAGVTMDAFVAKLDGSGNWLWAAQGSGSAYHGFCQAVAVDPLGNVFVAGNFGLGIAFGPVSLPTPPEANYEVHVTKIDSDGNPLWARRIGGDSSDKCYALAVDASGNAYVAGWFYETITWSGSASSLSSQGTSDVFVAKLNPAGTFQWVRRAGGTELDRAYSVAVDGSGNVAVVGYYTGTATFGAHQVTASSPISCEVFVTRLDTDGNFLWAQTTATGGDHGFAIASDAAGNSYITGDANHEIDFGTITLSESGLRVFVAGIDADGNWLWAEKGIADSVWSEGRGIAVDPEGRVHLAGRFFDSITLGTASFSFTDPFDSSSHGYIALRDPPLTTQVVVADPGGDFDAGATTTLTVEVHDGGGLMTGDDTTQITFDPTLSGTVTSVGTGTLTGGTLDVPGGAVTVGATSGVASITLTDTVAETFQVAITNDSAHADPDDLSYIVSPAAAAKVKVTDPGADFAAGASTTLSVEVQDQYGNTITADNSTEISFDPTLSGTVETVDTGTLAGGALGVPGGVVTVTVSGGVASITLTDVVQEAFTVAITDNAGLADPTPPSYTVGPAAPDAVVVTDAGMDFKAGAGTTLTVEVHDTLGNLMTGDGATQVTLDPTGNGTVSGIVTGSGTPGGPGEAVAVTVAGGVASVTLTDTVAETFQVTITNDASLSDPTPDPSYTVGPGDPYKVEVIDAGGDFTAGAATTLSVEVQDQYGNTITSDDLTEITFSPTGSGTVATVETGTLVGGSPGSPGVPVTVRVAAGVASVTLTDAVVESFQVDITNDSLLENPATGPGYTVTPAVAPIVGIPGGSGGCTPSGGGRPAAAVLLALLALAVTVRRRRARGLSA